MGNVRRRSVGVALLLLALVGLWLWRHQATRAPHAGDDETATARAGSSTSRAPAAGPPGTRNGGPPIDQITPMQPAAPPAISLPPDTQPLAEEFIPGMTAWEEVPLMEHSPLVMRFLPKRYNVIAPQPIVLYLEVVDKQTGRRVPVARASARLHRGVAQPGDRDWIDVRMADDGAGEDEARDDHRYTATFQPSEQDRLVGRVLAEGIVETAQSGVRRIPQWLIYTQGPRAKMTGRWRDERRDGHLFVEGEIDVADEGLFTLIGQIVGPAREPLAFVRTMERLGPGTH